MGAKLTMGCLGEGWKEGKEKHEARSGRSEHRKWRGGIEGASHTETGWWSVCLSG